MQGGSKIRQKGSQMGGCRAPRALTDAHKTRVRESKGERCETRREKTGPRRAFEATFQWVT